MAAGIIVRDAWIETMEKNLHEMFTCGMTDDDEWKKVWIQKKSNKRREEIFEYVKPDVVELTPEGAPYVQLRMEKARSATALHLDYTGMIVVTHQMQRDKMYDDMESQSWGLGESINRKLYEDAVAPYFNGFDSQVSPDNLSWFNAAHICSQRTSSSWSNLATGALDPDSFNDARTLMLNTLNENGKITSFGSKNLQLIYPAALDQQARRMCMKGQYAPGSGQFDILVHDIEPVMLPMLAMGPSAFRHSQWYVRDSKKAKNIQFTREEPTFDMYRDPATDNVVVKARVSYSFLVGSAAGVVGSKGL